MPNTAAQIISSGHLPPPGGDATFIGEIEKAIRTMARSPKSRETICFYIQENRYVYQMVTAFEAAEKTENLEALHALCSCMQTICESIEQLNNGSTDFFSRGQYFSTNTPCMSTFSQTICGWASLVCLSVRFLFFLPPCVTLRYGPRRS